MKCHSNLIFEGFASFRQVDDSVKSNFSQLMTKLSNQIEQNDWQKITSQMSVVLKNKLNILYGL
ncbi:hypothetical protein HZS_1301 [Henneguya salminicola]|nr:hypothetical protein HZS_1301 [Henneguya salminicola]